MTDTQAARALGWASLGIGLTEMVAPVWLSDKMGLQEDHKKLLRALGGRECASGVSLLGTRASETQKLTMGLWSRVAGDVMDLALLGAATKTTRRPVGLAVAAAMVLGITALDVLYAQRFQRNQ